MSQAEMAAEFQVHRGAVANWETGMRKVPGPILKLMDLYEESLSSSNASLKEDSEILSLKKYFETLQGSEYEKALRILERGFASYVGTQSTLDTLTSQVKRILIERLLASLEKSHGVAAKIAQMASFMELGLSPEIRNALGTLQSRAKPMKPALIRQIMAEEYGEDYRKTFSYWNSEPLAVTSIGQVHYARLNDGQEVAVKIQHPEIRAILESQLNKAQTVQFLLALFGKGGEDILSEIRIGLLQELDYRKEAENQEKFRLALARDSRIHIPRVHGEFLRDRVLVSNYVRGKSFQTFMTTAPQRERDEAAEAIIESLATMAFGHCLTHTDLHPGNFLFLDGKVAILDFGRVIKTDEHSTKTQCQLYLSCFEDGDYEKTRRLAQTVFGADNPDFDFDSFWKLLLRSHIHLQTDEKFHFTREFAAYMGRQWKEYSKKHRTKISKEMLWGTVFSISTWGLYADLDARVRFKPVALKTMRLGAQAMT
jgi:predicted unusual protein kinase regulating ubiquinone biosynthesis (AarF/ABC1/UbiB family)